MNYRIQIESPNGLQIIDTMDLETAYILFWAFKNTKDWQPGITRIDLQLLTEDQPIWITINYCIFLIPEMG